MDITSDFIYVRLHGSTELYKSAYSRPGIRRWAARVKAWRDGTPMTDGHSSSQAAAPRPRDVFSTSTTPTSCRRQRMPWR